MAKPWIELDLLKSRLADFFEQQKKPLVTFGSTVNQVFEAFVFAAVIGWYRDRGWGITIHNPIDSETGKPVFKLKFSTRGRPSNYSYAECVNGFDVIQIRHQLRVSTYYSRNTEQHPANICLDVAVVRPTDFASFTTDTALQNNGLITFGEAKHMSAFAELVAGFIGLVHELQPTRLRRVRKKNRDKSNVSDLAPFLYVSGILYYTAQGIKETITSRGYDIDIFSQTDALAQTPVLAASMK